MNKEKLIKNLIKAGESNQLEFKQVIRRDIAGKTICAFLNGTGGQILFGVTDDKKITGVSDAEKWVTQLRDYLNKNIVPDAPVMVSLENIGDRKIIMIKVWAGSRQPYIFDGSIYYRKGIKTVRATSQEISELIHNRQKAEIRWERQFTIGIELEDMDIEEIQKTISHSINENRLDENKRNPIDFLTHFGLYQNNNFTNAAVVLFAKNPARYLPQIRVRVSFLEDGKTSDNYLDDRLLECNLFKNIDVIQSFI